MGTGNCIGGGRVNATFALTSTIKTDLTNAYSQLAQLAARSN